MYKLLHGAKITNSFFRLPALMLVFLMLFSPLAPAFADDVAAGSGTTDSTVSQTTTTTTDSTTSTDQTISSGQTTTDNSNQTTTSTISNTSGTSDSTTQSSTDSSSSGSSQQQSSQQSPPPPSNQPTSSGPDYSSRAVVQSNSDSLKRLGKTDPTTGAFVYGYPFTFPKGRNGIEPSFSLAYNSSLKNNDSMVGYGWTFDIPYIQHINKKGSETIYTNEYFTSSLSGDLVNVSGTAYAPKVENGDFSTYTYNNSTWTVTDKKGTVYTYGASAATRQDDPNNSARIYKWMLEKEEDTNGNYITYTYTKDAGQIYPDTITYTNDANGTGIYTVTFTKSAADMSPTMYFADFPVKTNYQISRIEISTNGVWTRAYDLAYTLGDAGYRKLLSSITESGKDEITGVVTTKPPSRFTYKTHDLMGWTLSSSSQWNSPIPILDTVYAGPSDIQFRDINGDGYPDAISNTGMIPINSSVQTPDQVYLSDTHGGWSFDPNDWALPSLTSRASGYNGYDIGAEVVDYNGDLYPDVITSSIENCEPATGGTFTSETHQNNMPGATSWAINASVSSPMANSCYTPNHPHPPYLYNNAVEYPDFNGDGIPDIVHRITFVANSVSTTFENLYTGDGTAWTATAAGQWNFPENLLNSDRDSYNVQNVDLNGDGLPDVYYGIIDNRPYHNDIQHEYVNTGHDWNLIYSSGLSPDIYFSYYDLSAASGNYVPLRDYGSRFTDLNGDGIPDFISTPPSQSSYAFLNTLQEPTNGGTQFTAITSPTVPIPLSTESAELVDINADGMDDIVQYREYYSVYYGNLTSINTWLNTGTPWTDMLIGVDTPEGAHADVSYKMSTKYFDSNNNLLNPHLPLLIPTVSSIVVTDGNGNTATTSYTYAEGSYYYNGPYDRKFAGFGIVTETDPSGNVTKTYYHQANAAHPTLGEYDDQWSKIGKPYRVEEYDVNGNLYRLSITKWDRFNIGTDHDFVFPAQTLEMDYDGMTSARSKATSYTYDTSNGNQTEKIDWGEVTGNTDGTFTDISTDKVTTDTAYAQNMTAYILGLPSQETITDQNSALQAETNYYYDNQTAGNVTLGNLTREEHLISTGVYAVTNNTYNSDGLVMTTTDPDGNQTSYVYDIHNLYPAKVTNALNQVTAYQYDYSSGKPKVTTDPNGYVFTTTYDGFDRVIQEQVPDPNNPSISVTKRTVSYNDSTFPNSTDELLFADNSLSHENLSYIDGLARPIQSRSESENPGTYAVADTVYDTAGNVHQQSLPYFASGSAYTSATTNTALMTTYAYDALKRVTTAATNVGPTSYSYADWTTTVTDPNTHAHVFHNDAYGRLIGTDEHNGANIYITQYAYDTLGNLITITDASGNVRHFTYDDLGRRLFAQDLHDPIDTTFGTWQYSYDLAGNLLGSTDPDLHNIAYTYDSLNRALTEDNTATLGPDITYNYDTCTGGIGHLCDVTMPAVTTHYAYVPSGKVKTEQRIINTKPYLTTFGYDYQDNITGIQYPDGNRLAVTYNTAFLPETENHNAVPIVLNADYAPTGAPMHIDFGNTTHTDNVYDPSQLYRLIHKQTANSGTTFQNIAYTYDPVGNVTSLTDTGTTRASRAVTYTYDGLNRLLNATATNTGNGQNYTENYSYSPLGNILSGPQGPYSYLGNTGANYADPDAVTAVGGTPALYDNAGNLLSFGPSLVNTYDYRNQLATTVTPTDSLTYGYDHAGQRVSLTDNTTTTVYPNQYYDTDLTTTTNHIYLGSTLIADAQTKASNTTYHFIAADHLTGTNIVTDKVGALEQTLDYLPYGETRVNVQAGSFDAEKQFGGHYYDQGSDLTYFGARYYDAKIGKFISEDPSFLVLGDTQATKTNTGEDMSQVLMDPQGLNSYSYVENNPLTKVDPNGKFLIPALALAAVAFDVHSFNQSLNKGSTWGAIGNAALLVMDSIAVVTPGVPALGEPRAIAGAAEGIADAAKLGEVAQTAEGTSDASKAAGETAKVHGNSLQSTKTNYLYQLVDRDSGQLLKYGESLTPDTRYSKTFLDKINANLEKIASGTKQEIHQLQNQNILEYKSLNGGSRPPLNKSDW